jgi:2-hydroxycyclohexanecarboxyl-CoA dehydrogenase
MDLELHGHKAIITGGASGIGRAVAERFAREGAATAIWDLSHETQAVAAQIADRHGTPALGLLCNVADEDSVRAAHDRTLREWGAIDHLVHAAAVGSGKYGFPFTNLRPADWRSSLEVNIMGMVHVAHVVAPPMQQRRSGTLVFIASVAGQIGSQTDPPYSAAKAANINFAQCLAKDMAPAGVRVNTVCPGMVQTSLNRSVWQAWNNLQPEERKRTYEDWAADKIHSVVPLGRWQSPEDVADMVVFLSSARAAQVTGQTINVDGGFVMHW